MHTFRAVLRRRVTLGLCCVAVGACCSVEIVTNKLPDGKVDVPYSFELDADCDNDRWELTSGDLPPGISLSSDGRFRGTPTLEGTYTMTIGVDGESDEFVTKGFSITIAPADTVPAVSGAF